MSSYFNPSTTFASGRTTVTTAGTEVPLASSARCDWVVITAETDNTGLIAVGDSSAVAAAGSQQGVLLAAGQLLTLPIDNLAKVYIDSSVNGDGVAYLYGR